MEEETHCPCPSPVTRRRPGTVNEVRRTPTLMKRRWRKVLTPKACLPVLVSGLASLGFPQSPNPSPLTTFRLHIADSDGLDFRCCPRERYFIRLLYTRRQHVPSRCALFRDFDMGTWTDYPTCRLSLTATCINPVNAVIANPPAGKKPSSLEFFSMIGIFNYPCAHFAST